MDHFQVRVAFPGGGRMTFGVQAPTAEAAREIAGKRITGLAGAEVEIVRLPVPWGR